MISILVMLSKEKAKKDRHDVFLQNSNNYHVLFSMFSLSVQILVWSVIVN